MKQNSVAQYVNQKKQIKNGAAYCGASSVAMITGEAPQHVADIIGDTADDTKLTGYLAEHGFETHKISDGGSENTRWAYTPSGKDFSAMRAAIDAGRVVLYHIAGWDKKSSGHYVICIGYDDQDNFIFYDPAGDRKQGYFNDHGQGATYSKPDLITAGIKRLFSVGVKS